MNYAVYSASPSDPQLLVTWYEAARFCNWLSEREGIPRDQWCYEPSKQAALLKDHTAGYGEGMAIRTNYRHLAGYRLPTSVEWEYACRAGSTSSFFFGRSLALAPEYCWSAEQANERVEPVWGRMPNPWGLFGMAGNVKEWCQDSLGQSGLVGDSGKVLNANYKLLKGGSIGGSAKMARSARLSVMRPDMRAIDHGFRVVRLAD